MRNKIGRRKSEMWISNNKVLIGGGTKKPHARNPNFETEETKLLISLWGDPKVQKTLITTHKKHPVIAKLAEKMREHGYYRSPEEINTRIKNLKCFYNRIKKDLEVGVTTEPSWRHYSAMDEILTRPIFGNRVQQPHLQNITNTETKLDDEPKELRPEDLLSVEEEYDEGDVDFEDGSIIPKDEPIDIDDIEEMADSEDESNEKADEVDDVNDIFPKLSYYLQLASNSALKGAVAPTKTPANDGSTTPVMDIKTSPPPSPIPEDESSPPVTVAKIPATSNPHPQVTTTTTKMILTPISVASSLASIVSGAVGASTFTTTSASSLTNKISLVPTNILMKPSVSTHSATTTGTAQFSFKPQQFICTKSGVGTSTTNTGQMKYLLVNTLQKPPSTVTSISSSTVSGVNTLSARSLVNIQPKIQVSTSSSNAAPYQTRSATAIANAVANGTRAMPAKKYIYATAAPTMNDSSPGMDKRPGSWKYGKSSPGFRTLLHQLVQLQNKTVDLSRQRLDVEKERLSYERDTGEKILNVLTTLLTQRNGDKTSSNDDK